MAKSNYTRQQLFILRNHIPVDSLIENLEIPCKTIEGYFRFCCPVCRGFNTAVNPKTNLARCFDCRKNHNTIDLVMLVKRLSFINSVKLLQNLYDKKQESPQPNPRKREMSSVQVVTIGEIFKSLKPDNGSVPPNQKENPIYNQFNERIRQLEKKVTYLMQKIIEQNS